MALKPGHVFVKIQLPRDRAIFLKTEAIRRDLAIGEIVDEALRGLEDFKAADKRDRKR